MRYRAKLTHFISSEKKRLQNSLTTSNIQIASVATDTFGKSSMNIVNKLLENPSNTEIDVDSLAYSKMRNKILELKLAIDGVIIPEQAGKFIIIKQHYESLKARKTELEKLILSFAEPYKKEMN